MHRLRRAGQDDEALQRAAREGRLPTLAVEVALGGSGKHTLTHVAKESGLSPPFVREMMQAMGRPNPGARERAFSDEDIELARLVRRFLDAGLPRAELLEIGRVLSQGMSNAAEAIRRAAGNALLKPGDSEYTVGLRYARAAEELAPLVPSVLDLQFRAHLRDGIRGQLVSEAEREAGYLLGTRTVAIAFADLVGYTRLGERLPAEDLGRIAGRLSDLSVRAVRRPVKLVKTIGDAAMFMSPDVPKLLSALLDLMASLEREDSEFPQLRVGVAYGPATARGGDWFGATVNVASRITGLAKPGRVMATEAVQELSPDLPWSRKRRRNLKGVEGRVRLFVLDPASKAPLSGPGAGPAASQKGG